MAKAKKGKGRGPWRVLGPAIYWTAADGSEQVAHRGEVRDDLLAKSVGWLTKEGLVEEVTSGDEAPGE